MRPSIPCGISDSPPDGFLLFAIVETEIKHIRFAFSRLSVSGIIKSAKLARKLGKDFEHAIKVLFGMGGHVASAHDGLAVADGGINCGGGENSFLEEPLRKLEGLRLTADQDRNDRGFGGSNLETNAS